MKFRLDTSCITDALKFSSFISAYHREIHNLCYRIVTYII